MSKKACTLRQEREEEAQEKECFLGVIVWVEIGDVNREHQDHDSTMYIYIYTLLIYIYIN